MQCMILIWQMLNCNALYDSDLEKGCIAMLCMILIWKMLDCNAKYDSDLENAKLQCYVWFWFGKMLNCNAMFDSDLENAKFQCSVWFWMSVEVSPPWFCFISSIQSSMSNQFISINFETFPKSCMYLTCIKYRNKETKNKPLNLINLIIILKHIKLKYIL